MDALAKVEVEGFAQREARTCFSPCQLLGWEAGELLRTGVSGTLRREQPDNWTSYGCRRYVAIRSSTMPRSSSSTMPSWYSGNAGRYAPGGA